MARPALPRPTDAELAVLRVLWARGPRTVRQVHEEIGADRPVGYTTTLKMMQIMAEKGLVERDETSRSHIYHARKSEQKTQRQLIRDLLDRAFGGSARKLFVQALAETKASPQEMAEIRKLLESQRGGAEMNALHDSLAQPRVVLLGWTLLQFLWQGSLIAGLLWLILRAMKRSAAEARYAVACGAMVLLLLCPLMTFASMTVEDIRRVTAYGGDAVPASTFASILRPFARAIGSPEADRLLSSFAAAWAMGVLVLSTRLLAGWIRVQRIRRSAVPVASMVFQGRLSVMALRLGINKPVGLMESALASGPAVVGFFRPMILFPTAALTGLWPVQVEAIFAHELAHVRRHDYLVNLLQCLIETLLFYHPAVWWVSAKIRQERENCCDDLAVKACAARPLPSAGDRTFYAGCLADLEDLRPAQPLLAMGAAAGSLLGRVQRILSLAPGGNGAGAPALGALAIAALFVVALAQAGLRENSAATIARVTPGFPSTIQAKATEPSRIVAIPDKSAVSDVESAVDDVQDAAGESAEKSAPALAIDFPTLRPESLWNAARWVERKWPSQQAIAANPVVPANSPQRADPADEVSDFPPVSLMVVPPVQSAAPPPVATVGPRPASSVPAPPSTTLQLFQGRYLVARMPLMSVTGGPIMSVSGGPVLSVQGGPIMSVRGGPIMTLSPGPLTNHSPNYPRLTPALPPMTARTNGQR